MHFNLGLLSLGIELFVPSLYEFPGQWFIGLESKGYFTFMKVWAYYQQEDHLNLQDIGNSKTLCLVHLTFNLGV